LIRDLDPKKYYKECRLVLVDKEDLQPEKSMLCYHPHGILCCGFSWCGCHHPEFAENRHGDIIWLVAESLTQLPFFKAVVKWMGNIQSAAKPNMIRLMKAQKNIAIIPGGFQDATIMKKGSHRIWLRKRMGFIKYALVYGYRLHPIYVFGESDTFFSVQRLLNFRLWLNNFGLPGVLFWGEWWIPIFPKSSARIVTVIGKALHLPRIPEPSDEDVQKYHGRYVAALEELFETHKAAAGYPDSKLEIW